MSACPDCERLRETAGRPDVVCLHHDLIRIGQTFRDMPLSFADAHKQIDTLRQRAERAEADRDKLQSHVDICTENEAWASQSEWQTAAETAQSTIAELTAAVERMREALAPFAFFAERWEANPLGRIADDFYTIHGGMEDKEASIRLSDCKKARAALGAP